jgi:hypothetical protein
VATTGSPGPGSARRAFLLSPARLDGKRAEVLLRPQARFDLAVRVREVGAPIGEVYEFLSGLYFRGKLAYARATSARTGDRVRVITPCRGLVPPETVVTREDLLALATVPIDEAEPRYREPMEAAARRLDDDLGGTGLAVLLGSIATGKYVDLLLRVFRERLVFPREFVGRGDMSRGGLLLRRSRDGTELDCVPVAGAVRHGPRPPRLVPVR